MVKLAVIRSCRPMKKEQRCESMLTNLKMTPSASYGEEEAAINTNIKFHPARVKMLTTHCLTTADLKTQKSR